jgi:hypothetical protein
MNLSKLTTTQRLIVFSLIGIIALLIIVLAPKQSTTSQKKTPILPSSTKNLEHGNTDSLSQQDSLAREKLLLKILHGNYSGVVYESKRVRVEYIQSVNRFNAEILTPNTSQTKQEVSTWFQNNGISQQGLCSLPLIFHLGMDIENQMGESAKTFNPLPDGC